MSWINPIGLLAVAVLMIPTVLFAGKDKRIFEHQWQNKKLELFEKIGRIACIVLMSFNIPGTWSGFSSVAAFAVYLIVNALLATAYCAVWKFYPAEKTLCRAVLLSAIPSVLFLFSGVITQSLLLVIAAAIFAPCHIVISCKNAAA